MVSFHRIPTGSRLTLFATAMAAALPWLTGAPVPAEAQETVIIGGSGLPAVEVHLDAIEAYGRSMAPPRRLLIPGEPRRPLTGTLVLRPPGGSSAPPTPAPKLRPPAVAVAPILKPPVLKPPAPTPPAPVPALRKAPVPAPPAPVVAAVPPPPPPAPSAVAAPAAPPPSAVPAPATTPAPAPREQAAVTPTIPIPAPAPAPAPAPTRVQPPPPTVAPPPPAPSAAPQQEVAALPPVQFINVDDLQALRVLFSGASTRLSPQGEQQLKALSKQLGGSNSRLQLKAYGGGSSETVSAARRLSLSRALAVRSYLIEQGIRSTRIDVRALGIAKDGGPAERVDLVLLAR